MHYKMFRGLNDSNIGCLLIPIEAVFEWDENPDA
jgi:hypothetical protein